MWQISAKYGADLMPRLLGERVPREVSRRSGGVAEHDRWRGPGPNRSPFDAGCYSTAPDPPCAR